MKVHRDLPLTNIRTLVVLATGRGGGHTQHILYYDLLIFDLRDLVVVRNLQYIYIYYIYICIFTYAYILHYIQSPHGKNRLLYPTKRISLVLRGLHDTSLPSGEVFRMALCLAPLLHTKAFAGVDDVTGNQ